MPTTPAAEPATPLPPELARQHTAAAARRAAVAASPVCKPLNVTTSFFVERNPATGALTLNGTVAVANSGRFVVALDRVGIRVCSRSLSIGHLRDEAECPSYDVPAGGKLVCTWRQALPAPPAAGWSLNAWTGVFG